MSARCYLCDAAALVKRGSVPLCALCAQRLDREREPEPRRPPPVPARVPDPRATPPMLAIDAAEQCLRGEQTECYPGNPCRVHSCTSLNCWCPPVISPALP